MAVETEARIESGTEEEMQRVTIDGIISNIGYKLRHHRSAVPVAVGSYNQLKKTDQSLLYLKSRGSNEK